MLLFQADFHRVSNCVRPSISVGDKRVEWISITKGPAQRGPAGACGGHRPPLEGATGFTPQLSNASLFSLPSVSSQHRSSTIPSLTLPLLFFFSSRVHPAFSAASCNVGIAASRTSAPLGYRRRVCKTETSTLSSRMRPG